MPQSTLSPQHVESLWRSWREREGRRHAAPGEPPEPPAVEEEPTLDVEAEMASPALDPGPWREDAAYRLAIMHEPRAVPAAEEEPALPSNFGAEDATPSGRQHPLLRGSAEPRLATVDEPWDLPAVGEGPQIPRRLEVDDLAPPRRPGADAGGLPRSESARSAVFPAAETLVRPKIAGLLLIGVALTSAAYAVYISRSGEGFGMHAFPEHLAQDAPTGAGDGALVGGVASSSDGKAVSAASSGEVANSAAVLESIFSFKDQDGLREQQLSVSGCNVVVADNFYGALSAGRERQELSRFDLRRFHPVQPDAPDRLLLAADADADQDLLPWYDALESATAEEGWVQTLLRRADAGEFGAFVARNRHETRINSGDGVQAPFLRPLLQVSLRLPQHAAAPAATAWHAYVRDHCPPG